MTSRTREPAEALRRVIENAVLLIFASLLVMSVALGRFADGLLWCGALMVCFAHSCDGRERRRLQGDDQAGRAQSPRTRRYDVVRWVGLALAFIGAAGVAR
jgi:hypothetical protein